jgi:HSP20 family protein
MNMMTRWNLGSNSVTLRGIDEMMRHFFDQLDFSPEGMIDCGCALRMEVETKDNEVIVKLPIAGCKPEDFDVEIVGEELTVRAKRQVCDCNRVGEKKHFVRRERSMEEFEESIKLPVEVKASESKAQYTDGILTLTFPVAEKEKNRTHQIKVN